MQRVRYRLNPEMIDAFVKYRSSDPESSQIEAFDVINYLNTGYFLKSEEEEVIEGKVKLFKEMVFKHGVTSVNIEVVRSLLPGFGQTNIFCSTVFEDIQIGGEIDFMGFGKAFIFKGLNRYQIPSLNNSNELWLMRALANTGLKELNFIAISEGNVNVETYSPGTYDFGKLEDNLILFRDFIEQHKTAITNKLIFGDDTGRT